MTRLPLAIQLYTLRDLTAKDFAGTVNQVAKIGYPAVELAGFGNLKTASAVKKAVEDAGLKISSAHGALDRLEGKLNNVLDDNELLGNRYIVCPFVPENRRKSADDWRKIAASLQKIGTACKARGFEFLYHHHSFEFQEFTLRDPADTAVEANPPLDSSELEKCGFDILLANTTADVVKIEADTYWLKHGGEDPVEYLHKLADRIVLVHLKDMGPGGDQRFAEVGEGILNFRQILDACRELQVKWAIVEQDNCYETPPLKAIETSLKNLKAMGA